MITLKYSNKNKINNIIHCADFHIRLLKRHTEYNEVFNLFYEKLKQEVNEHTCLVIAGDVFHTKINLSAEAVDMCSEVFKTCADILPTIIIPGNHDFLITNKNRLDNISPIVNALNHPNIFYLKESGLYSFNNILFNHFSAFDEMDKYITYNKIPVKTITAHDYIIALSHLPINGSVNFHGYQFQGGNYNTSLFKSHDIVLMGDNHKHQEVQSYNKSAKQPIIVYPGSFIQQNHGESLKKHGYLKWDLKTKKYDFVELENNYGYVTIDIIDGKTKTDFKGFPKYVRLRIRSKNTSQSQINQILSDVSLHTSILETTYLKDVDEITPTDIVTNDALNEINITDVTYQNKLLNTFLESRDVSKTTIETIKKLNLDTHASLSKEYKLSNYRWTPKSFQFSNMFSYGENNFIDFANMKNIIGLFAKNAEGKCVRGNTEIEIMFNWYDVFKKIKYYPSELWTYKTTIKNIYTLYKKHGPLDISVKTPYGYRRIEACEITAPMSEVVFVLLENNMFLYASPRHRLKQVNGEFIKIKDINIHNQIPIETVDGHSKITKIEYLVDKEDLYDIQVSEVRQYYSNGIVSHNSSIWEAITFCIFDKYSKGFKTIDILNNQTDWFSCKFNFEINGVDYFIEREGKATKKKTLPVSVKFYKIVDGKEISLSGESRNYTNDIIREYLGTYDDFILTVLSLQNSRYNSFIELTQSERKDMLSQFLGLNVFDHLHDIANEKFKEIQVTLKNLNLTELTNEKTLLVNEIKTLKDNLDIYTKNIDLLEKEVNVYNDTIINLNNKIDNDIYSGPPLEELEITKNNILKNISQIESNVLTLKNTILKDTDEQKKYINKLNNLVNQYNLPDDVESIYNDYINLKNNLSNVNEKLNKIKYDVQNKLNKLKTLEKHEYDPNCKYCVNNVFVKDALKTKEELKDDEIKTNEIITQYNKIKNDLLKYENFESIYSEYKKLVKTVDDIKYKLLTYDNNILNNNNKINTEKTNLDGINKNIDKYLKSKNVIKQNNEIKQQINSVKDNINTKTNEIKNIQNEIIKTSTHKGQLNNQLTNIINNITKVNNLEKLYEAYKQYTCAINRDGIPYELIQQIIPSVEQEINNILQQIVEFNVNLETDGKNISTYIMYENRRWPLEMASGMEKFISSLAIRIALNNICNLPKPNILIIDEGFGVFDADHLDQLSNLFEYLKYKYKFVWIISHLEQMKDIVDIQLEIEKKDNMSYINYKVPYKT